MWLIWWMQERQVAAIPHTKPTYLGCKSLYAAAVHTHHHHVFLLLSLNADTHCTVLRRVKGSNESNVMRVVSAWRWWWPARCRDGRSVVAETTQLLWHQCRQVGSTQQRPHGVVRVASAADRRTEVTPGAGSVVILQTVIVLSLVAMLPDIWHMLGHLSLLMGLLCCRLCR